MRTLLACLAVFLLATRALAAGPSPVQDRAGMFKPETIEAVRSVVGPIEDGMLVQVQVETVKDVPAVPPESRAEALRALTEQAAARTPVRGTNDLLLIVACPEWKQVALHAGPLPFAQRVTPAVREAMMKHFARLFDAPDEVLPVAVDAVCRDLVALAHPKLTILDSARLFSPAAIDKAAAELSAFDGPFETRLVIETAPALAGLDPALAGQVFKGLNTRETNRRLAEIAAGRADRLKSQGLFRHAAYVLVVSDPPSVTVINWPNGFEGDLSSFRRGQIRDTFGRRRADRPDEALFQAVRQFKEFQESQRPTDSPIGSVQALTLMGGLIGAWLVLRVIRLKAQGPERKRLYTPALMGSLFGVPAGAWVYDQLFEAERPEVPQPEDVDSGFLSGPDLVVDARSEGSGDEVGKVVGPADDLRDPGPGAAI